MIVMKCNCVEGAKRPQHNYLKNYFAALPNLCRC